MEELSLTPEKIKQIKKRDPLFSQFLDDSRNRFINFLNSVPAYTKTITDLMQKGDLYQMVIPQEIIEKIECGEYEKLYNSTTNLWNGMIRKVDGHKEIVKQANWEQLKNNKVLENINQIALQASIAELTEQLLVIDNKIDCLISGQHEDRVSKIQSGILLYEQANLYTDKTLRDQLLINALQSLNEGNSSLFTELKTILAIKKRDRNIFDKLWDIIKVDKPEFDYFRACNSKLKNIEENIKFINLGSTYIFRIHALFNQVDAAEHSKSQFINFCNLLGNISDKDSIYPYELIELTRSFQLFEKSVNNCVKSDLIVEITYEELKNGQMCE